MKIGFQLIFQCVAYPPTHTFAIELLLHEKKNKISKEAQVYFHIGAGQATAAIIFRVTCTYIHTDTRIHMKRRESWEFFFGLYSWLSTADPRPVRHETLTESDLFRLVFLLVCGASKLFLTTTTDKIGFYYFHLVVWIVFFFVAVKVKPTRVQIKRHKKKSTSFEKKSCRHFYVREKLRFDGVMEQVVSSPALKQLDSGSVVGTQNTVTYY